MDDATDGGRWLSYAELAEVRGITRKAAVRMTQRHGWQRRRGNDGTARVLVPTTDAVSRRTADPDDDAAGKDQVIAALRGELSEANRRASDAVSLADRTLAMLADANARADRAEDAARKAQEAAAALRQTEEARKARGRLRRAWDGWRGR